MKTYEIWVLEKGKTGTVAATFTFVNTCTAPSFKEAMKMHFRQRSAVFYHEKWNDKYNTYKYSFTNSYIFTFNPQEENFPDVTKAICDFFLKPKEEKYCDCGSEKVYGKTGTHSHWCSLKQ
jgi:hypothetical protein